MPAKPDPPATDPNLLALRLTTVRDGPLDLVTHSGRLYVHIEGALLPTDERGQLLPGTPTWRWPPLFHVHVNDPYLLEDEVLAIGGRAEHPTLTLVLYLSGFAAFYRSYELGPDGVGELEFAHGRLTGHYWSIARWGDVVVGLSVTGRGAGRRAGAGGRFRGSAC